MPLIPTLAALALLASGPWTTQKAWKWFDAVGPIKGVVYDCSTSVNDTEAWQAETFDPKTLDREFGWAHDIGYNNVRVFLQYLVWENDAKGFKQRFSQFLKIANKHSIRVMPVLFDDCSFSIEEPYLGKQRDPIPGVHNSQWTPSPGHKEVTDHSKWPQLEHYVKDMVGSFSRDKRVLVWDLYNEPGNCGMGDKTLPLLEATFNWAREAHPSQPVTAGVWDWDNFSGPMTQKMLELSDVLSYHGYDDARVITSKLKQITPLGRPILCTEWLCREFNNTFQTILPVFAKENIGWYNSCLVAGRTQAYMHWNSKPGTPVPAVWQHCVLRQDGAPYDPAEIQLIKNWVPDTSARR